MDFINNPTLAFLPPGDSSVSGNITSPTSSNKLISESYVYSYIRSEKILIR
jgi:hypothetical protein